jgi:hypothetical protein
MTDEELTVIKARIGNLEAVLAVGPATFADLMPAQLQQIAIAYSRDVPALLAEVEHLQQSVTTQEEVHKVIEAENTALREIARAVAALPIHDTWHGNTIELYDCEYFHVFDEDAHALVDRARTLLEEASQ